MAKKLEISFERIILSILSGWLITQYFCLAFTPDAGISLEFTEKSNLILFAFFVILFSVPIFIADTKKRMEEVRNRLRKKARKEERQQIIEDIFADNSDSDDNSETAIVSSIADNILDD